MRDRQAGTTSRVSVMTGGGQLSGYFERPSISADGRDVTFASDTHQLPGATGNSQGTLEFISTGSNGAGDGDSGRAHISSDGGAVSFASSASNLTGNSNGSANIYRRDRTSGITTLVSVRNDGLAAGADGSSDIPGDGQYVVFLSSDPQITPSGGDSGGPIHRRDMVSNTATVVSASSAGAPTQGHS